MSDPLPPDSLLVFRRRMAEATTEKGERFARHMARVVLRERERDDDREPQPPKHR